MYYSKHLHFLLLYTLYTLCTQSLLEPYCISIPFMPQCRLRIRSFPQLTCLLLSESRCLPFDPGILSDRRSGTPICQNSVLFPHHTNISLIPSKNSTWAIRTPDSFSGKEMKIINMWNSMREKE